MTMLKMMTMTTMMKMMMMMTMMTTTTMMMMMMMMMVVVAAAASEAATRSDHRTRGGHAVRLLFLALRCHLHCKFAVWCGVAEQYEP